MTSKQTEEFLKARGFDESAGKTVGCSQCDAIAINGHACHETGCPNYVHECVGCCELIPVNHKYCEDCQ